MATNTERLSALADEAHAIRAAAVTARRDYTPDESARLTEIFVEFDGADDPRGRMATFRDQDVSLGRKTDPSPVGAGLEGPADDYRGSLAAPVTGTARRTAKALFGNRAEQLNGWRSPGEFLATVGTGRFDPRLIKATMSEGIEADGGFLVPTAWLSRILDESLEQEHIRPRADVVPMSAPTVRVAGADYTDRTSGAVAGLTPEWLAELEEATDQDIKFRSIVLQAKKLAIYSKASSELVQGRAPVRAAPAHRLRPRHRLWARPGAFLWGSGTGQPLGVLNATYANATINAAASSGQTADTITYANVLAMYARMIPSSINRAIWMVHPSVLPQLLTMTVAGDASTAVGPMTPIFTQNSDGSFTLLGRPVVVSEHLSMLGDVGDILFADWSQYVVGIQLAASLEMSNAPGWQVDALSFRMKLRVDGQPKHAAPITPVTGAVLSPFVALEARA